MNSFFGSNFDVSLLQSENAEDCGNDEGFDEDLMDLDNDDDMVDYEPNSVFSSSQNTIARITNMLNVVNLGTKINLPQLTRRLVNFSYKPSKFPCIHILHKDRKSGRTFNIDVFSNGKLTCKGPFLSVMESKKISRGFARKIQLAGYPDVKWKEFQVGSICCVMDMGYRINLYSLSRDVNLQTQYDPQVNSGVGVTLKNGSKCRVFHTGKVIYTTKCERAVQEVCQTMLRLLAIHRAKELL